MENMKILKNSKIFNIFDRGCWQRAGYNARSFDIQLSDEHDITGYSGVMCLMELLMRSVTCKHAACLIRLVHGGILICGPPCSVFVAASQSVHRRSMSKPQGDTRLACVRLSNIIWSNFAPWLTCASFTQILRRHV